MTLKLIALGVNKYASEPMNWLDGTVVMFSLLEETITSYIPWIEGLGSSAQADEEGGGDDSQLKSM